MTKTFSVIEYERLEILLGAVRLTGCDLLADFLSERGGTFSDPISESEKVFFHNEKRK